MDLPHSVALFGHLGFARKYDYFMAAYVLNYIIGGGGFSSRLMEEVREKRGLAYSVRSNLYPYRHRVERLGTLEAMLAWKADMIVVNEDWIERREESAREWLTQGLGPAGYEEVFNTRGWPERPGWRVVLNGILAIDPVLSNVRKVSPPISVWKRRPPT